MIQGTLLVIPIEEALLYIRPLYLRAAGGRIPELKRVIVAYQNQIVMEETLNGALDRLFGSGTGAAPPTLVAADAPPAPTDQAALSPPAPAGPADLGAEANQHYQSAIRAQRDGNWSLYGDEIRSLGEILDRMASGRTQQ